MKTMTAHPMNRSSRGAWRTAYVDQDQAVGCAAQENCFRVSKKVACIGGYLARANDSPLGNMIMWRACPLTDIQLGFSLAAKLVGIESYTGRLPLFSHPHPFKTSLLPCQS